MRLNQKEEFKPITITLETAEEAETFLKIIMYCSSKRPDHLKDMANKISNWFSNEAQLGGQ